MALVSPPCTVFAIPQRFRPSFVLGPVDLPIKQPKFSPTPNPPRGYPPLHQMGLLLLGTTTGMGEGIMMCSVGALNYL